MKTGALSVGAGDAMFAAVAWDGSSTSPAFDSGFDAPNTEQFNGGGLQSADKFETGSSTENVTITGASGADAWGMLLQFN